jgi:hypothetical protein
VRCALTRLLVVGITGCGSQVWWLLFLVSALLLRAPRCCDAVDDDSVASSERKSAMAWDLLDVAGKQLSPALSYPVGPAGPRLRDGLGPELAVSRTRAGTGASLNSEQHPGG